ncbi:hypothetical protein N7461_002961 [Penicillium sp. DV-2018c]|nr:hypothetical protein N7461_002961 [Penicillium sp. DV-2018c]
MSDLGKTPGASADSERSPGGSTCAKQQVLAALTATDVTIRRLNLLLSEANGQERALATIQYVASMLHHLTASAPWIALQARMGILARLRGGSPTKSLAAASSASKFKALSSLASETRYTLRLFGLLPLWIWGAETLKSPPADPILHVLTVLQVFSNVFYQILENVGYLSAKGIISKRFVDKYGGRAKFDIWSTRGCGWPRSAAAAGAVESKETKAEDSEATRLEIRAWKKSLVNNTIWAPLCLHWCVEKGLGIPDSMVGLISFGAGAWSLHDLWAATATVKA